ncbi:hypothetical protein M4I32_03730 [Microbacterium sp. LRZ72]|uniref:hypothetical protein n=1 Tax=Microbacterium sp. LRZ72 TaxID=2942481 RepID=UPI0029A3B1AF|nr:hypothetical protein [Microbacterium sp. LRZ72]MDX2375906.1 hypothetical protein [Microbacterium sp. LRZ72]
MGGQVLGGGVIVLVAVALWMVYLLPTWHSRHRYYAAERNAVRLNQALRVLAETSETPGEVRLELSARTALHQQRLAKRLQAEKQSAELESLRADVEAARRAPAARRARARRRARLLASTLLLTGLAVIGVGVWQTVQTGSQLALWGGAVLAGLSLVILGRMSRVAARAASREKRVVEEAPVVTSATMQDLALTVERPRGWVPRPLPQPLASAAGSRASAQLDAAEAHEHLRRAAREAQLQERAARLRPEPVPLRAPAAPPAASPYAAMGRVDDAEIEAHVRELLRQRAAG